MMKKMFAIVITAILLNTVLLALFGTSAVAQSSSDLDVAIVIDNSGSMNIGTRWENATESSNNFIDKLNPTDRAALFCFGITDNGSYGHPDCGPVRHRPFTTTDDSGKSSLISAIDALSPSTGYTPLFDTIGTTMDYVVSNKRSNVQGVVIAMTDGQDNTNFDFYPSHDYRNYDYVNSIGGYRYGLLNSTQVTFIIGLELTDSNYKEQLSSIAETSGGIYYDAASSEDMDEIFDKIKEDIDEVRDQNPQPSNFLNNSLLWLIIIILIAVVCSLIAYNSVTKKRTAGHSPPQYQQPPPPQYQQPPPPQYQQPPQKRPPGN